MYLYMQAGVFVSRSSVQLVQIRRVSVMTVLQLFNMVLWVVDVRVSHQLTFVRVCLFRYYRQKIFY